MNCQIPILIVIIPLISAFLIPLLGLWRRKLCYPFAIVSLFATLISATATLNRVIHSGTIHYYLGGWEPPWGIEYVIDHLSGLMAVLVSFVSLIVVISGRDSVEKELPGKTVYFYSAVLLLITGLLGMVVTGDMFNVYVFLEISSLSAYALIAVGEDGAPIASFNYMIMGTIGASFYLLGVGFLYSATGSLNMADLSRILPQLYYSKVIIAAFVLFMVGIGIKMALFPLHIWLPDSYTYAPSTVSALIAPLMTKVGIYVMIRIMFAVFQPDFSLEVIPAAKILSWMAAIAIIAGSIMAIAQSDLKRMLAYSSVAQIGYIVLGIGLANRQAFIGAVLHILNHAFTKGSLFLVAGAIMYKFGMRNIYQFRYLHRKMPYTMGAFTIAAFSMIGIPPTCGFFSKWYLILGSIEARQWIFTAILLISSLLNAIYFFRVIENIYLEPPINGEEEKAGDIAVDEAPLSMLIPILIMAGGIIFLGIFSGKIISTVIQYAVPGGF